MINVVTIFEMLPEVGNDTGTRPFHAGPRTADMSDAPRDPELERLAEDLSSTLAELQNELERRGPREPPRGPLGLPRPPTPGELLDLADEFAIPALIAFLEANVRALEAFQAALRLARAGEEVSERGRETRRQGERLGRDALDRLDDVLDDLQGALDGRPQDPTARTLADEARALRDEIDDRLAEGDRRVNRSTHDKRSIPARDERDESDDDVAIDVDAELDSIRDAVENDDAEDAE